MFVSFVGHLTRDVEIREGNGTNFLVFTVAVNEYNYSTKQTDTSFMRCTDFSPSGLKRAEYLKKGTNVYVVGNETVSIYNGANGAVLNREVRVSNFEFCGSKNNSDNNVSVQGEVVPQPQPSVATVAANTGAFVPPTTNVGSRVAVSVDDLPF